MVKSGIGKYVGGGEGVNTATGNNFKESAKMHHFVFSFSPSTALVLLFSLTLQSVSVGRQAFRYFQTSEFTFKFERSKAFYVDLKERKAE